MTSYLVRASPHDMHFGDTIFHSFRINDLPRDDKYTDTCSFNDLRILSPLRINNLWDSIFLMTA